MITGLKVEEMMKNVETTYTTTKTYEDPWWGTRTETTKHVVIDGKHYTVGTDRDGWLMLWAD